MARSVVVCPNDPNDIAKATEKLGCGKDRYGNSQYVCAPNQQKTELKEFCLQGTMEMIEGGNCLETYQGKLHRYRCTHFFGGCPKFPYRSSEILKYPACQSINTNLNCYSLDPSCQPQEGNTYILPFIILGVTNFLCLVIIFLGVVFTCLKWRRKRRKRCRKTTCMLLSEDNALTQKEARDSWRYCRSSTQGGIAGGEKYCRCSTQESFPDSGTCCRSSTQGDIAGSERYCRCSTQESLPVSERFCRSSAHGSSFNSGKYCRQFTQLDIAGSEKCSTHGSTFGSGKCSRCSTQGSIYFDTGTYGNSSAHESRINTGTYGNSSAHESRITETHL